MTRRETSSTSLDEVLARYASQAESFNPEALQRLIDEFPQHAQALRRYAQVQLISLPAKPEEIEREETPDEELLPMQSKLLLRMQRLRRAPREDDRRDAKRKLDAIRGKDKIQSAARAVLGGADAGEPSLFLNVIEPPGVFDTPAWFSASLAVHAECSFAAMQWAITQRQNGRGAIRSQKFSARERPKEAAPRSWRQAVTDTITDPKVRERILQRT